MTETLDSNDEARARELHLARRLATLLSFVLVGMGIMSMWTGYDYGRTSKLGGAEVSLFGAPAIAMGLSTALFGLFPLALWFRTRRPAIVWVVACLVAAAVAFYGSIRLGHA